MTCILDNDAMNADGWRDRLADAVARSGKSREAIALEAGLGRAYLYGVFKENKVPSVENLIALANAAGASPAFIIFGWKMTEQHEELMSLLAEDPKQIGAILTLLRKNAGE